LRMCRQKWRERVALLSGESDKITEARMRRTGKAVETAFQKYRSAPYRQPVLAFHCLDSEKYLHHSKKDWLRAAPHMEMIELNCLHHEILVEPHVREVARIIERSLALSQTANLAKTQPSTV